MAQGANFAKVVCYQPSVTEPVLPYGRQLIEADDEAAVLEALRSPFLTQGPRVEKFEEALAATTGARHAVAVANGTAALHLAALAAGARSGSHGLTSDVTFVASANGMRYAGATPHLVDVDPDTGLATAHAFQARIDALAAQQIVPKLFVPVDLTGSVADLPALLGLARRSGALVVEDAAHSLGALYGEGLAHRAASCTHADMAILSFHPVKHITTGEGGAITTNDDALARELRLLRTHGITRERSAANAEEGPWWYEQVALGLNYRITDLQCALGISQLAKLGRFVARRRELAAAYDRRFASSARVRPLRSSPGSSYHLYVVRVTAAPGEDLASVARRRKALFIALRERGIYAQVHYIPVHRQPDFVANGLTEGSFPGADAYYASCISLPLFPAMVDADVDRVVDAVESSLETLAR